jgi:hypothetical protein
MQTKIFEEIEIKTLYDNYLSFFRGAKKNQFIYGLYILL